MILSEPLDYEHDSIVKYIRHIRTVDMILCAVFGLPGLALVAVGIYSAIDGFMYPAGFIITGVLFLLISLGCGISDTGRSKLIYSHDYSVCRCRVVERKSFRTRYHTDRKVTVLLPDGKNSTYKVNAETYRKAKEGVPALLVDYAKEQDEKPSFPVDMVIPDLRDE